MLDLLGQGNSAWNTFLQRPELAGPVLLIGMLLLLMAIAIVATTWAKCAKHQAEMSLKQSMVERGMSVDEIERVLKTGSSDK